MVFTHFMSTSGQSRGSQRGVCVKMTFWGDVNTISDNLQSKKAKNIEKMTISSIFQKPPPASIGPFDNPILCTQAMEWGF